MQINNDIFENLTAASTIRATTVAVSELIERPSKTTKAPVQYVRLNDDDHAELKAYVEAINTMRTDKTHTGSYIDVNLVLDKNSGIWGSELRKFSTLREVLAGVTAKLGRPHKYVRGRRGEDLSVKQLTAINQIIGELKCSPIAIPAK